MAQIQFSLIKKKKDWTSRTFANPPLPTSDNISFLPYPPHSPSPSPTLPTHKVDVICVSSLKKFRASRLNIDEQWYKGAKKNVQKLKK